MFMSRILKAHLYPYQKTGDFENRIKNVWAIKNFVSKDQKYRFCQINQVLQVSRNIKKMF